MYCADLVHVVDGGRGEEVWRVVTLLSLHLPLMSHAGLMIAHYTAASLGECPPRCS